MALRYLGVNFQQQDTCQRAERSFDCTARTRLSKMPRIISRSLRSVFKVLIRMGKPEPTACCACKPLQPCCHCNRCRKAKLQRHSPDITTRCVRALLSLHLIHFNAHSSISHRRHIDIPIIALQPKHCSQYGFAALPWHKLAFAVMHAYCSS